MAEYEIESLNKMFIIKKHVRNITTSSKIAADGIGNVTTANISPSIETIPGYTICGFRLFSSSNGYLHIVYIVPRGSAPNDPSATHYISRLHNKYSSAAPSSTTAVFRIDVVYIKNDYFTEET